MYSRKELGLIRYKRSLILFILAFVFSAICVLANNKIILGQEANIDQPDAVIQADLFGMHIHRAANRGAETTAWPTVPFATWRLWDARVTWPHLEPRKGEWDFETYLDKYVELADKNQVEILLPLGLSPTWASARPTEESPYFPGAAAEPKDIEDWRNYVRTVATRYKGRIRYYEIWNEPNAKGFYTGTVEQMVTLAREAYRILKDVDPSITVVSPAATGGDSGPTWVDGTSWLDEYFSKGGRDYADAIGYHFYVIPQPPEAIVPLIARVRTVMAKHGLSQKPLWNTELGWAEAKIFSSDEEAAAYVARSYILNWAGGASRLYWYAWDNTTWVSLYLTERDSKTLTAAAIAYTEVQKWLVGARMTGCTDSKNAWTCQVTREGGYTARIVWNPYGEVIFSLPENFPVQQVRDLTGAKRQLQGRKVKIGQSPVLFENSAI